MVRPPGTSGSIGDTTVTRSDRPMGSGFEFYDAACASSACARESSPGGTRAMPLDLQARRPSSHRLGARNKVARWLRSRARIAVVLQHEDGVGQPVECRAQCALLGFQSASMRERIWLLSDVSALGELLAGPLEPREPGPRGCPRPCCQAVRTVPGPVARSCSSSRHRDGDAMTKAATRRSSPTWREREAIARISSTAVGYTNRDPLPRRGCRESAT